MLLVWGVLVALFQHVWVSFQMHKEFHYGLHA
ncbi:hypothetical protein DSM14862_02426 [Sulfitobacter indolifex]|nr:hypothetical protein DSM14862_02426 [Sulfitobacter indolifex]